MNLRSLVPIAVTHWAGRCFSHPAGCRSLVAVAALALLWPAALNAGEGDWNQWRGPHRDGRVGQGAAPWPESLGEDKLELLWRIDLQPSYSGPVVAGDLVITTETRGQELEVVTALDRETGEVRWQTSWEGAMRVPFFARANGSWIRATPAHDADSDRLLAAGMLDVLVCLQASTGEELWRIDFVNQFDTPVPAFGFVSSPLIDGDSAYVQAGAALAKVGMDDGEVEWRAMEDGGGMYGSAFSSPVLETLAGRRQLLVQTRETLAGLEPESGDVLWSRDVPSFRGMNILTPLVSGNRVFTATYRHRAWAFEVSGADGSFHSEPAWEVNAAGYMSSPVEIDGHVYLHLQNQRFTCIDLSTGEQRWTSDRFGRYVSMVSQGNRILALDERGELLLIDANPDEFRLLGRRQVSEEECWAHLAVSGDRVYVRDLRGLSAWRWVEQGH